jgi:hypothetical protein
LSRSWTLALALALAGCPVADDGEPVDTDVVDPAADDLPQPFVDGVSLYPWPSEQYEVPDASTPSGWRVSVPQGLMPDGIEARVIDGDDGFSRVVPILAWLPGGFDATTFPDAADWGATTQDDSPVLLVREGTFELVPAMVEPDASATVPELAPMIVRPHRALDPATRYAVLVRRSVRRLDGAEHAVPDAITTLLSGADTDDRAVQSWRRRFDLVRDAAEAHHVPTDDILLAWTFRTRSQEQVIRDAVALQDVAATAPTAGYTIEDVWYCPGAEDNPADQAAHCSHTVREGDDRALIYGTFEVPDFLGDDARFVPGDDGLPTASGTMDAPFLITVPRTVSAPTPGLLLGHGFFSAIEEPLWSTQFDALEQWAMPAVTTKFYGFAEVDLTAPPGPGLPTTLSVFANLSDIDKVVDEQLQSHANFTVLHRLVSEHLATDPAARVDFGDGPFSPLTTDPMAYIGASNGGTQGLVMMTTSPVLTRGALVVPGGGWSHMLQRAVQWNQLAPVVVSRYLDDPRQLQLVMSMLQNAFDRVDSLNYVDHLIDDRLEGRPAAPDLLAVMAVNDAQVTNLVTSWVAGDAGFPLITPSPRPVWGLDEIPSGTPDVHVALEVFELGVADNPTGNVPPPEENGVHDGVRKLAAFHEEVGHFLTTGEIVHACDGPCSFTPEDW